MKTQIKTFKGNAHKLQGDVNDFLSKTTATVHEIRDVVPDPGNPGEFLIMIICSMNE